jgi:hypothetical protein
MTEGRFVCREEVVPMHSTVGEEIQALRAALQEPYRRQIAEAMLSAKQAWIEVLHPWWRDFARTQKAVALGFALEASGAWPLGTPISRPILFQGVPLETWQAVVTVRGVPGSLDLAVSRQPKHPPTRGWAHAMMRHQGPVDLDLTLAAMPMDFELHPRIVVHFAEQLAAGIVEYLIDQVIAAPGTKGVATATE